MIHVDDIEKEKWWRLHVQHGMTAVAIAKRFGLREAVVQQHLKERREREGVAPPSRPDAVNVRARLLFRFDDPLSSRTIVSYE